MVLESDQRHQQEEEMDQTLVPTTTIVICLEVHQEAFQDQARVICSEQSNLLTLFVQYSLLLLPEEEEAMSTSSIVLCHDLP